ncbi:MAG: hypothetical protein IK102_00620 [Treponema sp.]|nr:hypothetical protein [Treponema sp.]
MIAALIIILLIILFLSFFVGKNLTNVCTLWLFKTYTDLSVTVIVFIAFAAGIVFSLLCYMVAKLIRASHENEVADAKNYAQKQQKKQEKIDKKIQKQEEKLKKKEAKTSEKSSQSSVESQPKQADKVNIEDRIHE